MFTHFICLICGGSSVHSMLTFLHIYNTDGYIFFGKNVVMSLYHVIYTEGYLNFNFSFNFNFDAEINGRKDKVYSYDVYGFRRYGIRVIKKQKHDWHIK